MYKINISELSASGRESSYLEVIISSLRTLIESYVRAEKGRKHKCIKKNTRSLTEINIL